MARKKCALVACVRVCAQNISREEWFSVPSRTGHPPAYLPTKKKCWAAFQNNCKNVIRPPTYLHFKMLSVHLPTNEKCYPSTYLPAFQNVIRPPAYQRKMLSIHLPTCISKCYPSAYLPTKKCWATFQNNCLCFFKKIFV